MTGISVLNVKWKWPMIMLDPIRMFEHSRFNGQLVVNHPKVIDLIETTNNILRSNTNSALQTQ